MVCCIKRCSFLIIIIIGFINQTSSEFFTAATVESIIAKIAASIALKYVDKFVNSGSNSNKDLEMLVHRMDEFTFSLSSTNELISNSKDYMTQTIVERITHVNKLNDEMSDILKIVDAVHNQYNLLKEYATNDNRSIKHNDDTIIRWCFDNLGRSHTSLYSEMLGLHNKYDTVLKNLANEMKVSTHFMLHLNFLLINYS